MMDILGFQTVLPVCQTLNPTTHLNSLEHISKVDLHIYMHEFDHIRYLNLFPNKN